MADRHGANKKECGGKADRIEGQSQETNRQAKSNAAQIRHVLAPEPGYEPARERDGAHSPERRTEQCHSKDAVVQP